MIDLMFFFNGIYLDFYGDITNNSRIDIDVNGYDSLIGQ